MFVMEMFKIMTLFGILTFFVCGICVGNSIEAKESKLVANFLTFLSVIGLIIFIAGVIVYLYNLKS